jgi:hypothetical protein
LAITGLVTATSFTQEKTKEDMKKEKAEWTKGKGRIEIERRSNR